MLINLKKPVTSACYDKQHVCLSATVFALYEPITAKWRPYKGYPFLTPSFEGNPRTHGHEILSRKTRLPWQPTVKNFMILACIILIQCQGLPDGQTDKQTDGQTSRPWLRRAKHSAIARKNLVIFLLKVRTKILGMFLYTAAYIITTTVIIYYQRIPGFVRNFNWKGSRVSFLLLPFPCVSPLSPFISLLFLSLSFYAFPHLFFPLFLLSLPLEDPLKSRYMFGGALRAPPTRSGAKNRRSQIWCISVLKNEIWWQRVNSFNYFPKNKLIKLANLMQFKRMLMFLFSGLGTCPHRAFLVYATERIGQLYKIHSNKAILTTEARLTKQHVYMKLSWKIMKQNIP